MNAPPSTQSAEPAAPAPQALLRAWRESGAWRVDPAGFHTLEALARRLESQSPALRRVLQERLARGVGDYARCLAQAGGPTAPQRRSASPASHPLAALTAWIRDTRGPTGSAGDELASVHGFREVWSRLHAQEQVTRAAARKPAQAGPLNSQVLAFEALDCMAGISPGYLRRFMLYTESLQWLAAAAQSARAQPDKAPARRRASAASAPRARSRKP